MATAHVGGRRNAGLDMVTPRASWRWRQWPVALHTLLGWLPVTLQMAAVMFVGRPVDRLGDGAGQVAQLCAICSRERPGNTCGE